jgi:hypothetical protein
MLTRPYTLIGHGELPPFVLPLKKAAMNVAIILGIEKESEAV